MNEHVFQAGCKGLVMADEHLTQNYYNMLVEIAPELPHSKPGKLQSEKYDNLLSKDCINMIAREYEVRERIPHTWVCSRVNDLKCIFRAGGYF